MIELKASDVLVLPAALAFFGAIAYWVAAFGRRQGKAPVWKWVIAYGLEVAAIWYACVPLNSDTIPSNPGFWAWLTNGFGARSVYNRPMLVAAVLITFLFPLACIVGMAFLDKREIAHMRGLIAGE